MKSAVVRVHAEKLEKEKIPEELRGKHFWKYRTKISTRFEKYLTRNGTAIRSSS